ncbi:MAG: TonB-dependent receptor [Deltaproteobacteria bacterium]|nr:TonB-dependent receptor [Deltaproteobacteria bacterium]
MRQNACSRIFSILQVSLLFLLYPAAGYTQATLETKEAPGEPPRFELDEIVVTATRQEDTIRKIPRNVTVITSHDIEQAPGNNVVDLLGREAGVNLRSFFGSDKQAGVDIRGMGDTFVSNVIIMVDGLKLNPPDLAGPDLSTISMDQIERIEIVRGASSVIYGDGAVGGVVNIITKKGKGKPHLHLYTSYGSYDTSENRASCRGRIGKFSFNVNAGYYDSKGYRDNGYLRKKDAAARIGYDMGDHITFGLMASTHNDRYGLPGPVAKENINSKEKRTGTDWPQDFGKTSDDRYVASLEVDLETHGIIKANAGYRDRNNPFILHASAQQIDEETKHFNLGYKTVYELGGLEHKLRCGIDYYETDYVREEELTKKKSADVKSRGWFLTDEWSLPKNFILSAGYRKDRHEVDYRTDKYEDFFDPTPPFNYLFSRWVLRQTQAETWKNEAFDLGLTYLPDPATTLFANYSKSFRNPNVDELAEADDDLHPQKAAHLDIGARHRIKGVAELSVTVFQIKMKDEIYYGQDPLTGRSINRNYEEDTLRHGLEADVKVYPSDSVYLWGNYSYTKAEFEDRNTCIPLVPEHKATLGLEWQIEDSLLLTLTGTRVGSRYDGNDEKNNLYEKLKPYEVFDGKLMYKHGTMKIFVGVNNIFNELYCTTAYSETYYPMPGRSFYGGLEWRF